MLINMVLSYLSFFFAISSSFVFSFLFLDLVRPFLDLVRPRFLLFIFVIKTVMDSVSKRFDMDF
ncbi:hypothetical protein OIU79_004668 [Salix purpurea]|uniref:Uncharacterized protein n=1 Tax=Salix purpurea TaxID=77065 RepID=A0A9Q0UAQ9_SALPP|nr:hypothetical protein OIU79_004668 [Salix purpurea]